MHVRCFAESPARGRVLRKWRNCIIVIIIVTIVISVIIGPLVNDRGQAKAKAKMWASYMSEGRKTCPHKNLVQEFSQRHEL